MHVYVTDSCHFKWGDNSVAAQAEVVKVEETEAGEIKEAIKDIENVK